jgi:hypothetical protein
MWKGRESLFHIQAAALPGAAFTAHYCFKAPLALQAMKFNLGGRAPGCCQV